MAAQTFKVTVSRCQGQTKHRQTLHVGTQLKPSLLFLGATIDCLRKTIATWRSATNKRTAGHTPPSPRGVADSDPPTDSRTADQQFITRFWYHGIGAESHIAHQPTGRLLHTRHLRVRPQCRRRRLEHAHLYRTLLAHQPRGISVAAHIGHQPTGGLSNAPAFAPLRQAIEMVHRRRRRWCTNRGAQERLPRLRATIGTASRGY